MFSGRWQIARGIGARMARAGGPPPDGPAPAMLIVSSRHRLWQRYGPDGVLALEQAVGDLVAALDQRGISGTLLYVDDSPLLTMLGVLPAQPGDPADVARVVREVAARLTLTDEHARYLLLLGDDGIVPHHRLANAADDDDDAVLSDQPYAVDGDDLGRPVRAVGRIPDSGLAMAVDALSAAAAAHRRLAAGERSPEIEAFGYSASFWKRAAREAYGAIDAPGRLRLSPPLAHPDVPHPGAEGPRFRYYNLHGLVDASEWFGQRDPGFGADTPEFPVALRPDDIGSVPGVVVMSEACHGARLIDRGPSDAIALAYLAGGALAFVGATGVAYGGIGDGPLLGADLLAQRFWQALLAGRPAGEALAHAKVGAVRDTMARQGYLDAEDEKAVANFILLGDPSLIHHVPDRGAHAASTAVSGVMTGPEGAMGAPSARSIPLARSTNVRAPEARVPEALAEHVRRAVARQMPGFGGDDVRIRLAHGPQVGAGVAARSAGGPARRGHVVVTMSRTVRTCAGPCCPTVLRVTVDGNGRIRKMAVSR